MKQLTMVDLREPLIEFENRCHYCKAPDDRVRKIVSTTNVEKKDREILSTAIGYGPESMAEVLHCFCMTCGFRYWMETAESKRRRDAKEKEAQARAEMAAFEHSKNPHVNCHCDIAEAMGTPGALDRLNDLTQSADDKTAKCNCDVGGLNVSEIQNAIKTLTDKAKKQVDVLGLRWGCDQCKQLYVNLPSDGYCLNCGNRLFPVDAIDCEGADDPETGRDDGDDEKMFCHYCGIDITLKAQGERAGKLACAGCCHKIDSGQVR